MICNGVTTIGAAASETTLIRSLFFQSSRQLNAIIDTMFQRRNQAAACEVIHVLLMTHE